MKWLAWISLVSVGCFASPISIELPNQNKTITYQQPVRLSQILNDAYQQLDYWPYELNSKLVETQANDEIITLRDDILSELDLLQTNSAKALIEQLSQFEYRKVVPIQLGFNHIRVYDRDNPLISNNHSLELTKRSNLFGLVGLVPKPIFIPLRSGANLSDYLETIEHFESADLAKPFIIQPDGHITQAHIGHWQNKLFYPASNAIVFIGIEGEDELNLKIANLLRYAVVKQ
ncbi:capsule biosynthesis GfcC family protein [Vibrio sp. SCSIO 43136]|uniref:capsule biosynthesis GfcC family protein n=1 Tax=Vibrio sp. SCSIO 43136 TaxID=2819101 RepID=UPI0020757ABD|nr:capsule biosynthesis GfcC family protein [Vibrio sp. SCSIO 43136]USD65133.1 capsule biosynthesis GfcC family protein [Vibrio sp. SCSIO 43136]